MGIVRKNGDGADSMRKLTKEMRKLLARAACLYAIANKKEEFNAAYKSYEDACQQAKVSTQSSLGYYRSISEDYWAGKLLRDSGQDLSKVKSVKLSMLPFQEARDMDQEYNAKISALNEAKAALGDKIQSNAQKRAEIQAKLKEIEDKVQDWKREHSAWRGLYYKENAGWGYDTPAGRFRPYGTFELSHDPKADYLYWEYENLFSTSYYTDRYDFHTPSEMEHKECGYDEESLWKKLREGHPGYGTIHCYITIWRCPKLLQEHEALVRELKKY